MYVPFFCNYVLYVGSVRNVLGMDAQSIICEGPLSLLSVMLEYPRSRKEMVVFKRIDQMIASAEVWKLKTQATVLRGIGVVQLKLDRTVRRSRLPA